MERIPIKSVRGWNADRRKHGFPNMLPLRLTGGDSKKR